MIDKVHSDTMYKFFFKNIKPFFLSSKNTFIA